MAARSMPGETALHEMLMAMPSNGDWMLGAGPHSRTMTILLDECSSLIAENAMPLDDIPTLWWVRLTLAGMAMRRTLGQL